MRSSAIVTQIIPYEGLLHLPFSSSDPDAGAYAAPIPDFLMLVICPLRLPRGGAFRYHVAARTSPDNRRPSRSAAASAPRSMWL
jgi:hypothetical protein